MQLKLTDVIWIFLTGPMVGGNLYHHRYGTALLCVCASVGWAVVDWYSDKRR